MFTLGDVADILDNALDTGISIVDALSRLSDCADQGILNREVCFQQLELLKNPPPTVIKRKTKENKRIVDIPKQQFNSEIELTKIQSKLGGIKSIVVRSSSSRIGSSGLETGKGKPKRTRAGRKHFKRKPCKLRVEKVGYSSTSYGSSDGYSYESQSSEGSVTDEKLSALPVSYKHTRNVKEGCVTVPVRLNGDNELVSKYSVKQLQTVTKESTISTRSEVIKTDKDVIVSPHEIPGEDINFETASIQQPVNDEDFFERYYTLTGNSVSEHRTTSDRKRDTVNTDSSLNVVKRPRAGTFILGGSTTPDKAEMKGLPIIDALDDLCKVADELLSACNEIGPLEETKSISDIQDDDNDDDFLALEASCSADELYLEKQLEDVQNQVSSFLNTFDEITEKNTMDINNIGNKTLPQPKILSFDKVTQTDIDDRKHQPRTIEDYEYDHTLVTTVTKSTDSRTHVTNVKGGPYDRPVNEKVKVIPADHKTYVSEMELPSGENSFVRDDSVKKEPIGRPETFTLSNIFGVSKPSQTSPSLVTRETQCSTAEITNDYSFLRSQPAPSRKKRPSTFILTTESGSCNVEAVDKVVEDRDTLPSPRGTSPRSSRDTYVLADKAPQEKCDHKSSLSGPRMHPKVKSDQMISLRYNDTTESGRVSQTVPVSTPVEELSSHRVTKVSNTSEKTTVVGDSPQGEPLNTEERPDAFHKLGKLYSYMSRSLTKLNEINKQYGVNYDIQSSDSEAGAGLYKIDDTSDGSDVDYPLDYESDKSSVIMGDNFSTSQVSCFGTSTEPDLASTRDINYSSAHSGIDLQESEITDEVHFEEYPNKEKIDTTWEQFYTKNEEMENLSINLFPLPVAKKVSDEMAKEENSSSWLVDSKKLLNRSEQRSAFVRYTSKDTHVHDKETPHKFPKFETKHNKDDFQSVSVEQEVPTSSDTIVESTSSVRHQQIKRTFVRNIENVFSTVEVDNSTSNRNVTHKPTDQDLVKDTGKTVSSVHKNSFTIKERPMTIDRGYVVQCVPDQESSTTSDVVKKSVSRESEDQQSVIQVQMGKESTAVANKVSTDNVLTSNTSNDTKDEIAKLRGLRSVSNVSEYFSSLSEKTRVIENRDRRRGFHILEKKVKRFHVPVKHKTKHSDVTRQNQDKTSHHGRSRWSQLQQQEYQFRKEESVPIETKCSMDDMAIHLSGEKAEDRPWKLSDSVFQFEELVGGRRRPLRSPYRRKSLEKIEKTGHVHKETLKNKNRQRTNLPSGNLKNDTTRSSKSYKESHHSNVHHTERRKSRERPKWMTGDLSAKQWQEIIESCKLFISPDHPREYEYEDQELFKGQSSLDQLTFDEALQQRKRNRRKWKTPKRSHSDPRPMLEQKENHSGISRSRTFVISPVGNPVDGDSIKLCKSKVAADMVTVGGKYSSTMSRYDRGEELYMSSPVFDSLFSDKESTPSSPLSSSISFQSYPGQSQSPPHKLEDESSLIHATGKTSEGFTHQRQMTESVHHNVSSCVTNLNEEVMKDNVRINVAKSSTRETDNKEAETTRQTGKVWSKACIQERAAIRSKKYGDSTLLGATTSTKAEDTGNGVLVKANSKIYKETVSHSTSNRNPNVMAEDQPFVTANIEVDNKMPSGPAWKPKTEQFTKYHDSRANHRELSSNTSQFVPCKETKLLTTKLDNLHEVRSHHKEEVSQVAKRSVTGDRAYLLKEGSSTDRKKDVVEVKNIKDGVKEMCKDKLAEKNIINQKETSTEKISVGGVSKLSDKSKDDYKNSKILHRSLKTARARTERDFLRPRTSEPITSESPGHSFFIPFSSSLPSSENRGKETIHKEEMKPENPIRDRPSTYVLSQNAINEKNTKTTSLTTDEKMEHVSTSISKRETVIEKRGTYVLQGTASITTGVEGSKLAKGLSSKFTSRPETSKKDQTKEADVKLNPDEADGEKGKDKNLGSRLASLRMQLEERRKHIEKEKKKMVEKWNEERTKSAQNVFWLMIGKDKQKEVEKTDIEDRIHSKSREDSLTRERKTWDVFIPKDEPNEADNECSPNADQTTKKKGLMFFPLNENKTSSKSLDFRETSHTLNSPPMECSTPLSPQAYNQRLHSNSSKSVHAEAKSTGQTTKTTDSVKDSHLLSHTSPRVLESHFILNDTSASVCSRAREIPKGNSHPHSVVKAASLGSPTKSNSEEQTTSSSSVSVSNTTKEIVVSSYQRSSSEAIDTPPQKDCSRKTEYGNSPPSWPRRSSGSPEITSSGVFFEDEIIRSSDLTPVGEKQSAPHHTLGSDRIQASQNITHTEASVESAVVTGRLVTRKTSYQGGYTSAENMINQENQEVPLEDQSSSLLARQDKNLGTFIHDSQMDRDQIVCEHTEKLPNKDFSLVEQDRTVRTSSETYFVTTSEVSEVQEQERKGMMWMVSGTEEKSPKVEETARALEEFANNEDSKATRHRSGGIALDIALSDSPSSTNEGTGSDGSNLAGMTPEQARKREKFIQNRMKQQQEMKAKREADLEKRRRKEEKMRERKEMLERKEEEGREKLRRRRQEEEEAIRLKEEEKEALRKKEEQMWRLRHFTSTKEELEVRQTVERFKPIGQPSSSHSGSTGHIHSPEEDVLANPGSSTFREYSGPPVYVKPSGKSNRKIIVNAISHCCLSGEVNKDAKEKCLQVLSTSDASHLLALFRDGLKFRGLYSYAPESDTVTKLYGLGPRQITTKMIEKLYKYNSGGKEFTQIHAKSFSIQVDGLTIKKEFWMSNKQGVSKTNTNLKKGATKTPRK